jgi:hypothetical protein
MKTSLAVLMTILMIMSSCKEKNEQRVYPIPPSSESSSSSDSSASTNTDSNSETNIVEESEIVEPKIIEELPVKIEKPKELMTYTELFNIPSNYRGVRLEDIKKYGAVKVPVLNQLALRMSRYQDFYFGPRDDLKVHMNFLIDKPRLKKDDTDKVLIKVGSVVEVANGLNVDASLWGGPIDAQFDSADTDNDHYIYVHHLMFDRKARRLDFQYEKSVQVFNVNDLEFEVKIGLKERRLILSEKENKDFEIVMPVGVGSIDMGVTKRGVYQFLTPIYEGQNIDTNLEKVSWAHRDDKDYYQGKPFIRFRTNKRRLGGWSQIGLHIKQNYKFKRGYDSHGCMRLRNEDLQTVFRLIMNSKTNRKGLVEASIKLKLGKWDKDHPMPKINNRIKIVKNFGTEQFPETGLDELGLTAVEYLNVSESEYKRIWDKLERDYKNNKIPVVRD